MLRVSTTFLLFLTCCFCGEKFGQSNYGESHIGTMSDKNRIKQLVNNLVVDIITADQEASAFCRTNQDVVIRETNVNESYIVSFTFPVTNSNQISVQKRHRVLYIEAKNPSINFEYEYVVALTNILNIRALSWTFNDGTLYVTVPYKGKFGVAADVSCSEDISNKIIYVPETKSGDADSEANASSIRTANGGSFGTKSEASSVVTASSSGSKSGASAGSGVTVGGNGIASGNTEVYSKTATSASRPNGGGESDATATADANSKAYAVTSVNAATSDNGPNSTSKARSVSKGSSYSGVVGSVATSASAAGARSKDSNGTRSTTGATGIASSYNVGAEKGLSASSTLTTSGSLSTGPEGISLSSSTSASNTVKVFGKKISSTVTTATAINKDGSSFSVKVTPKNNVTKSIIDVKL